MSIIYSIRKETLNCLFITYTTRSVAEMSLPSTSITNSSSTSKGTGSHHHHGGHFDLEVVLKGFSNCAQQNGQLDLGEYLYAFTELTRFFRLLGPIFGFVSSDLEEKLHTLEKHRRSENADKYKTIQSMITHEVATKRTRVNVHGLRSGSRSLLRLNRALEFLLEFMERVRLASPETRISTLASDVYHDTLAKHHIWLVRKMAAVAVYTLPHRNELIQTLCKHSEQEALNLVGHVVAAAKPIYEEIQQLLEENKLLDLP